MRKLNSRTGLVLVFALMAFTAACGTRASMEEIQAAEGRGGGAVTSDLASGDGGTVTDVGDAGNETTDTTLAPDTGGTTGGTPGGTTGGTTGGTGGTAAAGCTQQLRPIRIGQVGGWTSIVSDILTPSRAAMQVWVADTNARGGIACHPVVLTQKDDGGDPSRAAAAVEQLVTNNKVVALVGNQVTLSVAGFRSQAERLKVPAVGGDVLTFDWFQSPMLFPQGGDLNATVLGAVKQNVERGLPKTAVIYCVEAKTCTDANVIMQQSASKVGADVVYSSQISITATDFSAQCQAAKDRGAQQVLLAMDGSAISRFMRSCLALNYKPAVATSPIAVGSTVTNDPNVRNATMTLGSFIAPFTQQDTPEQRRYVEAMKKYAPNQPLDGSTSTAWVSGELLRAAIEGLGDKAKGEITSALVLEGLGTIKSNDLGGLTSKLTFSPGQAKAPANSCYFEILLTTDGYKAPKGSTPVCL